MGLAAEQKEQLLQQYDPALWAIVHRFDRKQHRGYDQWEDLHSECVIVFMEHLNNCSTLEEARKLPVWDMIHAMCKYVMTEQALSYPKGTAHFRKYISTAPERASYETFAEECCHDFSWDPMNDAPEKIEVDKFISGLSELDQKVIRRKMDGSRNCDVAQQLGVSKVKVTRAMKRIKEAYRKRVSRWNKIIE